MSRRKWSKARKEAARAAWTPERRVLAREKALAARNKEEGTSVEGTQPEAPPNEERTVLPEIEPDDGGMREAGLRRLRVEKVSVNPRLVEGMLVDSEGSVLESVDVGRNTNFAIGDELWVRRHPEVLELWEFVAMTDTELAVDMVGLPRDRRRVR